MKKRMVYLTVIFSLLIGCQPPQKPKDVVDSPPISEGVVKENPVPYEIDELQQIETPFESFSAVVEWLNDETVLYIMEATGKYEVHTFNVRSGESTLFYTSDSPITTVEANSTYELFVIQTAPSFTEGHLSVVDASGNLVCQWEFPDSQDLVYSWNPYTNNHIAVSSFHEDWTFEGYLLDVSTKEMTKKYFANPFVQWLGESKVGYINWNQDEPSLTAPLLAYDVLTDQTEQLMENVIMFTSLSNLVMTMTTNMENEQVAQYNFLDTKNFKNVHQFQAPLLSMYSNYVTPFYEYVSSTNLFYTFIPTSGGTVEGLSDSFQFVSFHVEEGEKEVLLEKLENKPIKFSPNGLFCLYGYQLEQLIFIPEKEMIDLVKYS
ncbi:hypothetical protein ABN702_04720 [Bacillus haimaensis]|uniref:YqgU-like beta propeller domain-containing protein n=1 Tax=Bacillus haimaensis TaxID=3160967 RepID=UPI003AA9D7A6